MKGKYFEKVNTSPNQKKLKKSLEGKGHTNVEVWWETVSGGPEMCGPEGGYFFVSDQNDIHPIGYSFKEAIEAIETWRWIDVRNNEVSK